MICGESRTTPLLPTVLQALANGASSLHTGSTSLSRVVAKSVLFRLRLRAKAAHTPLLLLFKP